MFAYCLNNPVNRLDVQGLYSVGFFVFEYTSDSSQKNENDSKDITEEFIELMERHTSELTAYYYHSLETVSIFGEYSVAGGSKINSATTAFFETMAFFIEKVKTGGDWDLKNGSYPAKDQFVFNGEIYSGEDIGNIHFGYVGSALYTPVFLHFGAGVYQIYSGSKWKYWKSFFDEPRDGEMISFGIELYKGRQH